MAGQLNYRARESRVGFLTDLPVGELTRSSLGMHAIRNFLEFQIGIRCLSQLFCTVSLREGGGEIFVITQFKKITSTDLKI